jgi:23S rRNA (guanosine2251-2'-O)-methyltransferase
MEHLEGRQSVLAALEARQRRIEVILIAHGAHIEKLQNLFDLASELNVPIKRVDRAQLDSMAHGATHGGVLAVATAKPRISAEQLFSLLENLSAAPLLLLLEGIDDARNLGFALRSADAFAVQAVLIKKHLWDLDAVEIARPSSGAYERMPLMQIDDVEVLQKLQRRGIRICGCVAGAKRTIHQTNLTEGVVLAIGGEKRGLSGAVRSLCDHFMSIPTAPGASSLSLSHACAVVTAEAFRQRNGSPSTGGEDEGPAVG